MLPVPRGPPPADGLQSIKISSLEAALAKLNINISIETLLKTIHDEEEARRVKLTAERRIALSKLALQPRPSEPTAGLEVTTVSHFVPKPTKPANIDPLAKKRCRRLLELTKEAFPDGKVPDPFTLTWLGVSQDVAASSPHVSL
ncbi:hypothetical protein BDN70DRAFT_843746 [Pholiota conissans]|uniref:Uncharacterized protein n=1 Tax=Pholiota conissans TaxID=109636 RepID=A0A9P5YQH3_9AGAR|nr:hypothetical protein BDN70DRAFT_843746 [Pholiota conissans]